MLKTTAITFLLVSALVMATFPSLGFGQAKARQMPLKLPKGTIIIQVRARDGGLLPDRVRERVRGVPNVWQFQSFLEGKTTDGVRVIGVEPAPILYIRSGDEVLTAVIVQGRGFESGDAPEAMVVGKTFAQNNKTALGLSIPGMLTETHFPPIIVGGQGFAIVGIYATGDLQTDDQVLVLLPTAQKLLNRPGRLSGVYVTPASPAAADQVARDLRRALGGAVEVTPLALRSGKPPPFLNHKVQKHVDSMTTRVLEG